MLSYYKLNVLKRKRTDEERPALKNQAGSSAASWVVCLEVGFLQSLPPHSGNRHQANLQCCRNHFEPFEGILTLLRRGEGNARFGLRTHWKEHSQRLNQIPTESRSPKRPQNRKRLKSSPGESNLVQQHRSRADIAEQNAQRKAVSHEKGA